MNEFEIIDRYFRRDRSRKDVLVGIGDDAALIKADPDAVVLSALAVSSEAPGDPHDGAAFARALARTALNRLAAQGAAPCWITLGLSLPEADADWLDAFSAALFSTIEPHGAVLIGGDTTRGPTAATLVAHGPAPAPRGRGAAAPRAGDAVYLTGELGNAAARDDPRGLADPRPARVNEGRRAWALSAAAGDLRHSLSATLTRILSPYGLGADIDAAVLPVSPAAGGRFRRAGGARLLMDAYADPELCFVVGADEEAAFSQVMAEFESRCTRVGRVAAETEIRRR